MNECNNVFEWLKIDLFLVSIVLWLLFILFDFKTESVDFENRSKKTNLNVFSHFDIDSNRRAIYNLIKMNRGVVDYVNKFEKYYNKNSN